MIVVTTAFIVLVAIAGVIWVFMWMKAIAIGIPAIIKSYLPNFGGSWGRILSFLRAWLFVLIYS